ncbi:MAG: endonuclease/exonuclease/phosphatase (EEP) superfamily protein YafD [Paracoccaceae bacterium]
MRHVFFLGPFFLVACVLVFSRLGNLHPLADSLAVFQLYLAMFALLLLAPAFLAGYRRFSTLGIVLVAAISFNALVAHVGSFGGENGQFSLYQKNLLFRQADRSALLADIATHRPDFLTFQEVSPANRQLLDELSRDYQAQHLCTFAAVGSTAVLSKWPLVAGQTLCARGFSAMQVRTPKGDIWVVSLHAHWPYPYGQAAHVAGMLPKLNALSGPIVLGGDFNMVPWSAAFKSVAQTIDGKRAGAVHYTLIRGGGLAWLAIDHIVVPKLATQISNQIRPRFSSDHFGLLAWFSLP